MLDEACAGHSRSQSGEASLGRSCWEVTVGEENALSRVSVSASLEGPHPVPLLSAEGDVVPEAYRAGDVHLLSRYISVLLQFLLFSVKW